jgi:hypothetical protein
VQDKFLNLKELGLLKGVKPDVAATGYDSTEEHDHS